MTPLSNALEAIGSQLEQPRADQLRPLVDEAREAIETLRHVPGGIGYEIDVMRALLQTVKAIEPQYVDAIEKGGAAFAETLENLGRGDRDRGWCRHNVPASKCDRCKVEEPEPQVYVDARGHRWALGKCLACDAHSGTARAEIKCEVVDPEGDER